ncbi:zinc finger CCCH domain-containing protein 13-like [Archocentrus centrarchus]|uniref:zinc finger CCCH domain-containing protein 13-like n=1 Tax=Archocentrus centrarchus TaxID=63155 RepID=UPI0011E9C35E|nr:zinc finger CCCH domain-containing protein 13-like [Archocentrus centrarchus]
MELRVCHCGWSSVTTYHGLRIHQGKNGCTPKGMRIPEDGQLGFHSFMEPQIRGAPSMFMHHRNSMAESQRERERERERQQQLEREQEREREREQERERQQQLEREWERKREREREREQEREQQKQLEREREKERQQQLERERERERQQQLERERAREREREQEREWEREQERERQQQLERERQQQLKRERETERKREREREKAQKLQKARQEKMKADLLQKIDIREHKMAEVRSSEIDCKGSLDAEWLEINDFFTEVIKVVEDAKQKALQSLEERRRKVKRDAQDLVQKLQREIDVLKKAIDESDKNPDLEVSPLIGLNESTDWKNLCDDTSLSFGTLRATTSATMKQIQQEIEKLSSIELKRISAFAVDVTLDPATAHQSLTISDDGKKVRNGGKTAKGPDSPQRPNEFSVLGLNRLTSGKSYWEVEVSKKNGWVLGVARRNDNRKGKLFLNPDNGYWAVVHYEDKKYAARTVPPMNLSLKEKPQKVGVFVDYEEGLVSFYDVMSQSHIFSFTECLFGGEILPYFSLHLKQDEKITDPLIISAVQKRS